jgi:hypothetical protein
MDDILWTRIRDYDFDLPLSEYGFSTRLAKENFWTKSFTKKAILEYRKFMYLAAKSDMMVSPSEVIDIVWHEHLVFTKSYHEFCQVLGKQIQHVPSTHQRDEFEKFRAAKERTLNLYKENFGKPPAAIWNFSGMYESLKLEKAAIKIRTFLLIGLLVFAMLIVPAYLLLRPVYIQINNPYFIFLYLVLTAVVFAAMLAHNWYQCSAIIKGADRGSFLFDLHPLELVYMKTQSIDRVIDGTINQMVLNKKVIIGETQLALVDGAAPTTPEEFVIIDLIQRIKGERSLAYGSLVKIIRSASPFANTESAMGALRKFVVKSAKFGRIFYVNFAVFSFVILLGLTRVITGIMRDKPVAQISVLVIVIAIAFAFYLYSLTRRPIFRPLMKYYAERLSKLQSGNEWEWSYALQGDAVLMPAVVFMAGRHDTSSGDSSSSSSCGSGCGSSCGGCGGD